MFWHASEQNEMRSPPNIFLERLFKPSVTWEGEPSDNSPDTTAQPDAEQSDIIGGSSTEITPSAHVIMAVIAPWTEPFLAYLTRQELPEDQNEARCIVRRSKAYRVHEGELYKKSTTGVLQRCISKRKGGTSWLKFMPDSVVTTPLLGPLLARLSVQAFIGRRPEQTLRT